MDYYYVQYLCGHVFNQIFLKLTHWFRINIKNEFYFFPKFHSITLYVDIYKTTEYLQTSGTLLSLR